MEARGAARAGRVSLLADILARKESDVATLRRRPRSGTTREVIDVVHALRRAAGAPLRLIAEVKLRSPSAGILSRALPPAVRALAYAEAGAAMVSILCDGPFFDGAWEHLGAARDRLDAAASTVPLLAKEFIVNERQLEEARDCGADGVLLIARIVSPSRLTALASAARAERLEPVVEVVDARELAAAMTAGARVVGVNARDLDTLEMDIERAARVLAAVPTGVAAIHLSGLRDALAVREVGRGRADAALVGEALMRLDDPRPLLREMVAAARG
jgi:indole-3-glycerol phosphate synthase